MCVAASNLHFLSLDPDEELWIQVTVKATSPHRGECAPLWLQVRTAVRLTAKWQHQSEALLAWVCVSPTCEEELQTDRRQHIKVRGFYLIYCEVAAAAGTNRQQNTEYIRLLFSPAANCSVWF